MATIASPEATLTMWPRPRSSSGRAAAVVTQAPRRLISRVARARASGAAPASWRAADPGVVDQNVDAAHPRHGLGDGGAHGIGVAHVAGDQLALAAEVDAAHHRSALTQRRGGRRADASAGAGDQHPHPGQVVRAHQCAAVPSSGRRPERDAGRPGVPLPRPSDTAPAMSTASQPTVTRPRAP